jgi:GMP synthase (glutamine-hydrolysing)
MNDKILILDFGSQFTQLIARRIRELNVYCEIQPCTKPIVYDDTMKGIILSGSPFSVNDPVAPSPDIAAMAARLPILAVCYGAQLLAKQSGGEVGKSNHREYGRAHLQDVAQDPLFATIVSGSQVWMSHSDTIKDLPYDFTVIARTDSIPVAAFKASPDYAPNPVYAIQFHPEVTHSTDGSQLLKNFVVGICCARQDWTPAAFIQETVDRIKQQAGNQKVVMALSGGVDSTVAATLIHRAIGDNLYCIFVDNGLLRKGEFEQVLEGYKHLGLNTKGVDARQRFYRDLEGVSDPEKKRKIIGKLFIDVFYEESQQLTGVSFLGQGTIYPDVIESMSVHGGPSATIKSHHNVGGLPDIMHLSLIEPLRSLFKDEVRKVGKELGIDDIFIGRHPFPGPGLGIRILGAVSEEKVLMLQEADAIYIQHLRDSGMYKEVWQAGAILLPVQSVGVMGDERTYEFTCALRAVTSVDGMTADWAHLPYDLLARISNDIINKVKGINRVVYDISSKPPATIEWE